MGRYGFFLGIIAAVVGLCFLAWRLSVAVDAQKQVAETAGSSAAQAIESPIRKAERLGAEAAVRNAIVAVEAIRAEQGSYSGVTTQAVHAFDPSLDASVAVVGATVSSYCVQAVSGTVTLHALGTGQPFLDGPCA